MKLGNAGIHHGNRASPQWLVSYDFWTGVQRHKDAARSYLSVFLGKFAPGSAIRYLPGSTLKKKKAKRPISVEHTTT